MESEQKCLVLRYVHCLRKNKIVVLHECTMCKHYNGMDFERINSSLCVKCMEKRDE